MTNLPEVFGCMAFGDAEMRRRLPPESYAALKRTMDRGEPLDPNLANIVADVIIPLSAAVPKFLRPDGFFLCSGILDTRLPEVLEAIEAAGLSIERTATRDDWCAVRAKRPEGASK